MKTRLFSILLLAVLMAAQIALVSSTPVSSAPDYSYQFLPGSGYAQGDAKATLKISAGWDNIHPIRVDWVAPNGTLVSYCYIAGGCGPTYDQSVADNGALVWRQFYFYISGNSRASGTYTAIVYERVLLDGLYYIQEMFRANFSIDGTPPPPPPPPGTPLATLDTTFGVNGLVTEIGTVWENTMTLQPDGKIVAGVGHTLARYSPSGSLDASFGTGGKASTTLNPIIDIVIQKDGKIVALDKGSFKVARFNSDGSPDSGFTNTGISLTGGKYAYALLIQDDGKIVAVGSIYDSSNTNENTLLVRYNTNGSLDTSFGVNGIITSGHTPGDDESFYAAALQPDGKIVAAGSKYKNGYNSIYLVRYNEDGSLDGTFGSGGIVSAHLDSGTNYAYAVKVQPDGKIVVAGDTWPINVNSSDILLERFDSHGAVDTGFGSGGLTTTDLRDRDGARDMFLQPDGMILIAGYAAVSGNARFVVARYTAAGKIDTSTGTSGYIMSNQSGEGTALGVQADGKIVVAGNITAGAFELLRYIPQTPLPGTPTLTSPADAATAGESVTFAWQAGPGGDPSSYEVMVDSQVTTTTAETLTTTLALGIHTWKVRASNLGGYSDWSPARTVEVRVYYIHLPVVKRP